MPVTIPEWFPPVTPADTLNGQDSINETVQTIIGEGEPLGPAYGPCQIGGKIIAQDYDAGSTTWTLVVAWCLGEVNSIERVWMDGEAPAAGVSLTHYVGTTSQTADATAAAAIPGYADTNVLTTPTGDIGVCYSVIQYDEADYPSFPQLVIELEGMEVQTTGGGATAYSNLPGLHLFDLITNDIYGLGETADFASFDAVADDNTATVSTEARRLSGVYLGNPLKTTEWVAILAGYAGCWVYKRGGTWYARSDRPSSQDSALTVTNFLRDSFQIDYQAPDRIPTVVEVEYTDRTENVWRSRTATFEVTGVSSGAVPRRASRVRMPGVYRYSQAMREATERQQKLARAALSVRYVGFENELVRELGDVIDLTHASGPSGEDFRVTEPPRFQRGRISVTAAPYSASDYSDVEPADPTFGSNSRVIGDGVPSFAGLTNSDIAALMPLGIRYGEGSMSLNLTANENTGGAEDGEILVSDGVYRLPDGTVRTVSAASNVWTPYEAATKPSDEIFYIVSGSSDAEVRFASLTFPAFAGAHVNGVFLMRYDRTGNTFYAVDNDNVEESFVPASDDVIIAVGQKQSTSGGIDFLIPLVAQVVDPEGSLSATIYFQASAPGSANANDYWIDSNDENKLYRYNGASWVDVSNTEIAQAILDAATAQATADGKIETFAQAAPPTASGVGDIWLDTNDDNRLYRWNGSSWIDYRDDTIGDAILAASDAQSTADGKIVTFYQTTAPTAEGTGDFWIDSNDGNKLYRWSGSSWVEIQDTEIADALSDAQTAQATADGKIVTFVQTTAPTAEGTGDLWFDTNDGNRLYRWSGSSWVNYRDTTIADAVLAASNAQATADGKVVTFYQTTAPTAEGVGDFWVDSNDGNKLYRWSGSSWVNIQDDEITDAITDASNAQATADGKITTFIAASAPTADGVGDLWFDSNDNNKLYRWNSSLVWVAYAQEEADWTLVFGTGKPEDDATEGATVGDNLKYDNGGVIPPDALLNADDATALGLNPNFANWTGDRPVGWDLWGSPNPTKETSIVQPGPYGPRYSAAGGNDGMQAIVSFAYSNDTVFLGFYDCYIVTHTSGGGPGMNIDLRDGASNYYRRAFPADVTKVGQWQRVPMLVSREDFDANVGSSTNSFDSLRLYIMGSWAAMPGGGEWFGDVIFGRFQFELLPPDIANTFQEWADVTGTGKPEDDATEGANWVTNVDGLVYAVGDASTLVSLPTQRTTAGSTYVKVKEFTVGSSGVIRLSYQVAKGGLDPAPGGVQFRQSGSTTEFLAIGSSNSGYFSQVIDMTLNNDNNVEVWLISDGATTTFIRNLEVTVDLYGRGESVVTD